MSPRAHYFGAGPAALPLEVLEQIQSELLDYRGTGVSILELSHRSAAYEQLHHQTLDGLRRLLGLSSAHRALLLPGGGRLQFAMLPLNLLRPGASADYVLTGRWSVAALEQARAVGAARTAGAGQDAAGEFTRIPSAAELSLDPDAVYCHLTSNSTIEGVQWPAFPDLGPTPLIADMSSDFLARRCDPRPFGAIYAAAHKNLGAAGLSVVILREDLLERCRTDLPPALQYRAHAAHDSLLGTPPVFQIYAASLLLRWIERRGGLAAMERDNRAKADLLYDVVDGSGGFYRSGAGPEHRSFTTVVFRLADATLTARLLEHAAHEGLLGLAGHRLLGGLRVSTYNAVTLASVQALGAFLKDFARRAA